MIGPIQDRPLRTIVGADLVSARIIIGDYNVTRTNKTGHSFLYPVNGAHRGPISAGRDRYCPNGVSGGGKILGSSLIGQNFDDPKYFWGRISATSPFYNASSSSGSNLGPTNPALLDEVKSRITALKAADPKNNNPIPVDLVTSSGSGLDPHISQAAANYQLARVARVRRLRPDVVKQIVDQNTQGRFLGFLGEPVVNVLQVNLALDEYKKGRRSLS